MNAMNGWLERIHVIFDWFFPSFCVQCKTLINAEQGICDYCLSDLPLLDLKAHPNLLFRPDIVEFFPDCQFDHLVACAWYQPPFDHWLKQLKFNNQIYYKKILERIIMQQLAIARLTCEQWPELFIILPLHKARFLQRGYNQVAQTWAACLKNNALQLTHLQRNKKTHAQSGLTKAKRIKNMHDAFTCPYDLTGKTVAIIDDVMTTGATLNSATHALKQAGAKEVWAFVTCLTPLGR